MQEVRVNLRYRDQHGNIVEVKPVVQQEPIQVLRDFSIALFVLGGLIWALQHLFIPATAV